MAFNTPYEDSRGVAYSSTYCRATIGMCHKNETFINVAIYARQDCAPTAESGGKDPIELKTVRVQTDMQLQAGNPIEYAYKLLEACGVFPNATWNV